VLGARLYQLVAQGRTGSWGLTFEIEFLDPDVRAYAFTFDRLVANKRLDGT